VLTVGEGLLAQTVSDQVKSYAKMGWVLAGYLESKLSEDSTNPDVLGDISQTRSTADS